MQPVSQRKFINTCLIAGLLILALTNYLAYVQIHRLFNSSNWVMHTHKIIEVADQILLDVTDAESRTTLSLYSNNEAIKKIIPRLLNSINENITLLKTFTIDNLQQQKNIQQLDSSLKAKIELMRLILTTAKSDRAAALTLAGSEKRMFLKEQVNNDIQQVTDYEFSLLDQRNKILQKEARNTNLSIISASILSELLFLLSIILLNYYLHQKDKAEENQKASEANLIAMNQKLRDVEEKFKLALESSNTGLWEWDVSTGQVYFSENFKHMLGYKEDEFPSGSTFFTNAIHPDDHDLVLNLVTQHLEKNIPYMIEYRLKNKAGKYNWYQAIGQVQRDEQGNPTRMSGLLADINERKKVEKMKNEFVSVVSHELRTPLTSIHGAVALLIAKEKTTLSADGNQLLAIAKTNCERLIRLINDILDIEKIESGKLEFNLQPTELNELIKQAIDHNRMYAEKFSTKITFYSKAPQVIVNVDRDRLTQAITNLLSNAIKFSPKNKSVSVETTLITEQTVKVSISDKGKGIPENFKKYIFKKFSQADSSSTRKYEGSGLGLSISKAIIEKLEGTINFISSEDEGTTFYFYLPVHNATIIENKIDNKQLTKILIVEHDTDIAKYLVDICQHANLATQIAYNEQQVEDYLGQGDINAIILDLNLPDSDAISLLKRLRKNQKYSALPAIVITLDKASDMSKICGTAIHIVDWIDEKLDQKRLLQAVSLVKKAINFKKANLLHVEDDQDLAKVVNSVLEKDCNVTHANSLTEAKTQLANNEFDAIILDLKLPDGSAIDILPYCSQKNIPVIVFSAYEFPREYLTYAHSVLTKSKTTNKELLETINSVIKRKKTVEL